VITLPLVTKALKVTSHAATAMEAFLEYFQPTWTTHREEGLVKSNEDAIPAPLLAMIRRILKEKPSEEDFAIGKGLLLVKDDAAGDPASLGTHCIGVLKGYDLSDPSAYQYHENYPVVIKELMDPLRLAVDQQLDFLLNHAPKVSTLQRDTRRIKDADACATDEGRGNLP
jgi:hypothetical protein